ncbi:family 20 glycosylhydrolase [Candidatus Sumerlaeota bacterium]|nr:family 20 glycosylhydrolase [Candidatus Sumerlaeota bacterium]
MRNWSKVLLILPFAHASAVHQGNVESANRKEEWRAFHLFAPWHNEMPLFKRTISEYLAPMGVNAIILEVNYKYAWRFHPELREPGESLTPNDVKELLELCRKYDIRLIPLFNCLGHQSWEETNFPLIVEYPELDETPQIPLDNKGVYCRSWCPLHPKTNEIVFDLFTELIVAFEAKEFHVGMDEAFLIANEGCPRCRGKNPAEIYARAINDYYDFLVTKNNLTMMMWGDRLIDRKLIDYGGDYECSSIGTAPAIDMIPRDIIICDWHYEPREEYPSIPWFQEKGFRVLATPWKNLNATMKYISYVEKNKTDKMLGYLFTAWVPAREICAAILEEEDGAALTPIAKEAAATLRHAMRFLSER